MKKFVAVAGNIGVGKSTLVDLLSVRLGWEPFFEPVAENPYLADFYANMDAWSFHSQIFFLTHRLRSHYDLAKHPPRSFRTGVFMRMPKSSLKIYTCRDTFNPGIIRRIENFMRRPCASFRPRIWSCICALLCPLC